MTDRNNGRIDGFLDLETHDPSLRRRYQDVLDAQLGPQWPLGRTGRYILIGVSGLIGFLVIGSLSLTEPVTTPAPVRGLLFVLALISLAWAVFAGWSLARRRGGFPAERLLASRIAVCATLAALIGLGLTASALGKAGDATPMLLIALALFAVAAVGVIDARIQDAELAIREQLLRLESRIALGTQSILPKGTGDPNASREPEAI